ncbi:hypothetical protein B7494_g5485 [Chlorociboria aeruginascens]|nr:hypothetical protein B7494_g5485 [Chlorociboria aeruginascens]
MTSVTQNFGVAPHLLSPVGNQVAVSDTPKDPQVGKPRDVETTFNYFKDNADGSPPEPNYISRPTSYVREMDSRRLVVHDIRGSEDQYTLDTTGFQIYKHESAEKDFLDDDQIQQFYYPETEELLKKATGASKIFIFDHTIRRQPIDSREKPASDSTVNVPPLNLRGPVRRVHIDQSYPAALERVRYHLPDEAETLLKGRVQIINVWRPIKTILKDPFAVAAANSVEEDELVPIKLVYPHRVGETLGVRPTKVERKDGGHKWYYVFRQTPNEVTLIKCFDSKVDGRARRVPHSAFTDEEFEHEYPRESIEVRALVFHPDDTA